MRRALLAIVLVPALAGAAMPDGVRRGKVTYVFDGDTIEVALGDRRERVRLIGVDTPETRENPKLDRDVARSGRSRRELEALGRRASAYTSDAALGREVGLELDVERRDRYHRLLAYVWLPDGRLLNAELVRAGHARVLTVPPNVRRVDLFRRLQSEARRDGRGMWRNGRSPATPRPPPARVR